jgi:hypothetical protein
MLENDIQRTILDYLSYRGVFHYRNNTSGIYIAKSQSYRPSHSKGASDIIGCTKEGRFLAIEVKKPGGKATPEQKEFIEKVNASGGLAFIAYSVEDVEKHLNESDNATRRNLQA